MELGIFKNAELHRFHREQKTESRLFEIPFAVTLRSSFLGCWCSFFGLLAVFLLKPFDAAGGINQLLLAGKERMALGTNFNLEVSGS